MFYSCRAFPVSSNNGGHGSPLPAPWPFSVALENRARRARQAGRHRQAEYVPFREKCVSRSRATDKARLRVRSRKIPDLNSVAHVAARSWSPCEAIFSRQKFHTFLANDRPPAENTFSGRRPNGFFSAVS